MSEPQLPGPGPQAPAAHDLLRLLRELVTEVDSGRLQASSTERAHLVGARDALDLLYKI